MIHTILVEIPDGAEDVEPRITRAIENVSWRRSTPVGRDGGMIRNDFAKVIEYHHERMTNDPTQFEVEEVNNETGHAFYVRRTDVGGAVTSMEGDAGLDGEILSWDTREQAEDAAKEIARAWFREPTE